MNQANKAPWHLWVVGIVSLLWNAFGAFDYIMTKTENRGYLAQVPGDLDANIAYFNSFPLLLNIFWGLGVWGAVAGSVLLLLRSKHAVTAFALSLIGAVGSMGSDLLNMGPPKPEAIDTPGYTYFAIAIILIATGLMLYSRAQAKKGVLK